MGKSLSRFLGAVQSNAQMVPKDFKHHLKSFISGLRLKNVLGQYSSELSLLSTKVEDLDTKLSKKNEDFDNLFIELQRERDFREKHVQESSQREGHFLNENQMLQEKNNTLLEQIHNLFEKERIKTKDEHSFQMDMYESQNKVLSKIEYQNREIEKLNEHNAKPKSPSKIGELGEDYVLLCLQSAFPNNTSIVRNNENNSGDILFRIENTEKYIMFEVKNYNKGTISSANNGKDISKFFLDLNNPCSSVPIHGGVLISLNGPVDLNSPSLVPKFYLGKPYLYIDSMKLQYPDPECLMKVVVHMMTFLIKNCEQMEVEGFGLKIENYQRNMKVLMQAYQKLYKNHETQRKNLESLKVSIESLNNLFLDDLKEAAEHEKNGQKSFNEEFT